MAHPTRRMNGTHMVTVRATHHVSRREAAAILAMREEQDEEGYPPTWDGIIRAIREHLGAHGRERLDWTGDYVEDDAVDQAEEHLATAFGWAG